MAVTLLDPGIPAAEQPFTVAGSGFSPASGTGSGEPLWRGRAQRGDPGFEGRVPRLTENSLERGGAEAVGDRLCLIMSVLHGGALREWLWPSKELGLAGALIGQDR